MAFTAATTWEIRTTGSGSNGGGFDASLGGTDYSQQDSPQLNLSDGVCTGNTTFTSVTGGFTSAMIGNVITIPGTGFYQITAVASSNSLTVDKNGPNAVALNFRVGGAYKLDQNGFGFSPVAGNKIWIKAGQYDLRVNSPTISVGSVTNPVIVEGYNTTRGDCAASVSLARPVLKWSLSFIAMLTFNATGIIVRCLEMNCSGSGGAPAVSFTSSAANCILENCKVTADTAGDGVSLDGNKNCVRRCFVLAGTGASNGILVTGTGNHLVEFNRMKGGTGNTAAGIYLQNGAAFCRGNICESFQSGVLSNDTVLRNGFLEQNVFWLNTYGLRINASQQGAAGISACRWNIFGRNSTSDIEYSPSDISANPGVINWMAEVFDTNFFYTTGTNRYKNLAAGTNDQVLTANPFTDDSTGNYTLNSTAGGGALIRSTTISVTFADAINTAYIYGGFVGAPQIATDASTNLSTLRTLWRELTGEQDTTEVPNTTVDIYLMSGLEALNRRVGYHLTTAPSAVTLVDGTEEYDIPTDCVEVVFVEHNGQPLEKSSIEEWRKEGINWRYGKKGKPAEWAMYGNKLVVYPRPDAQTVAESANLALRYISTPPSITTSGPEQLSTQDWRVVVYFGVAEWSRSYPDGAFAQKRADDYQAKFEAEAALIAKNYQSRGVSR
jgi:hypothetical protein